MPLTPSEKAKMTRAKRRKLAKKAEKLIKRAELLKADAASRKFCVVDDCMQEPDPQSNYGRCFGCEAYAWFGY